MIKRISSVSLALVLLFSCALAETAPAVGTTPAADAAPETDTVPEQISFVKNGSYYDVDQGVAPDVFIRSYDLFYDRQAPDGHD